MFKGELAEIQYPWHHPDGRKIIVLCGGVRDKTYTAGVRVAGIHQWVTYLKHVDRKLEEEHRQLEETLNSLEIANKHEQFRADILKYVMHNEELDDVIDYISIRMMEVFNYEQLLYRDIEGRQIVKDRPGLPKLNVSLCANCAHYKFGSPVYADGFTVMDDCKKGYKGVPVAQECPLVHPLHGLFTKTIRFSAILPSIT